MVPLLLAYGADISQRKKNGRSLESIVPADQLQEFCRQAEELKKSIIEVHGSLFESSVENKHVVVEKQ